MRDPARIDRILAKLADYWKRHPDLRLCQLVHNLGDWSRRPNRGPDVFYVEDEALEKALEEFERWACRTEE